MNRLFFGCVCFVAAIIGIETDAAAFCRTTTCVCRPGHDKPLPERDGLPQSTCGQADGDCPKDEHGCRKTGTPVAWAGGCIGYSANLAGTTQLSSDEFNAAFDQAFQTWALVDCGGGRHPSIQVFTLRPTTCAVSEFNQTGPNVNSLYFTDNGWADAKTTDELDEVIAKTKVHFLHTGELVDADIAINSARHAFSVGNDTDLVSYDLISVLTHEAGHFLGLDHSDDRSAVMYWTYPPGGVNRVLQDDDIKAICTVYPPDRVTTCDATPKGGLEDTCGPAPKLSTGCTITLEAPAERNTIFPVALTIFGVTALRRMRFKRGKGR